MRLHLTLIYLLSFVATYAQKPDWIRNSEVAEESSGYVDGKRIAVHPDGSVFVLGQYGGSTALGGEPLVSRPNSIADGFLAKYDSNGDLIWLKQIFESAPWYINRVIDIKVDYAGDLVFSGTCYYPTSILGSEQGQGVFIAKMDKDATIKWVNFEPGVSLHDSDVGRRGNRIGFDPQHNILLYTDQIFTISFDNEVGGLAVIKYTSDGTKVSNTFVTRNPTFYHPYMNDFAVDGEGNFIVSGSYESDIAFVGGPAFRNNVPSPRINPRQFFLAKFSASGNFLWAIHTDMGGACVVTAHTVDQDGNIFFSAQMHAGATMYSESGTHFSNGDRFLAQVTPDGKLEWLNQLNNTSVRDIVQTPDGLLYVTGSSFGNFRYQSYIYSNLAGPSQAFVLKINTAGYFYGVLHGKEHDNPATPYGADVYAYQTVVDVDGNIYTVGGFSEGMSWGCVPAVAKEPSFYLVKHLPVDSPVREISGPSGQICDGTSITLTTDLISNAVLYKWFTPGGEDPGDGTPLTNSITTVMLSEHDKQPVIVSITDNCDEYFAEPFILSVQAPPPRPEVILGEDFVCPGSSEMFAVSEVEGSAYQWTLPAGITAPDQTTNTASLVFAGNFNRGTVYVSLSNFCGTSELAFDIATYVRPVPPALAGSYALCEGVSVIQKSISPVAHAISYQWVLPPFISHDPAYPENTTTLYASALPQFQSGEIKIRAVGHCQISDTSSPLIVYRTGDPGNAKAMDGPAEVCSSNGEAVTYSVPIIPNAENYIWQIPDFFDIKGKVTTAVPNIDLRAQGAGSGVLSVYGVNSCSDEADHSYLSVESYTPLMQPVLTLSDCHHSLIVTNADDFDWYFNGNFSQELTGDHVMLSDSGAYHVEVNNFCGLRRSNIVHAYPVIPSVLSLPNVITPNGDGANDYFEIDKSLKSSNLEIMNRWGSSVYSADNYQNNWNADGLASGSYIYLLRNHCLSRPYRGQIHVLR